MPVQHRRANSRRRPPPIGAGRRSIRSSPPRPPPAGRRSVVRSNARQIAYLARPRWTTMIRDQWSKVGASPLGALVADDSDECWDRTRRCSRARISRACVSSVGSSSWAMSETTRPPYITCFSAGKCLVADSAPYSDGDVHALEGHFGGHPGGQESVSELIPLHARQPTHSTATC